MSIEQDDVRHIETSTGTYTLRHVTRDYWVVWSNRTNLPIGKYSDLEIAIESLNSIKMGDPLLHPDAKFSSIDEVVETAKTFYGDWDTLPQELSISEKLLVAVKRCDSVSEAKMLADLSLAALRLERGDAQA